MVSYRQRWVSSTCMAIMGRAGWRVAAEKPVPMEKTTSCETFQKHWMALCASLSEKNCYAYNMHTYIHIHMYSLGTMRMWWRFTMFDLPWPNECFDATTSYMTNRGSNEQGPENLPHMSVPIEVACLCNIHRGYGLPHKKSSGNVQGWFHIWTVTVHVTTYKLPCIHRG